MDNGDRDERILGVRSPDEPVDLVLEFALDVFTALSPRDLRKEKGESTDDRELRVDNELLDASAFCFSFCSFFFSFRARCSPTNSRSGSVQITSNMAGSMPLKHVNTRWLCFGGRPRRPTGMRAPRLALQARNMCRGDLARESSKSFL